MYIYLYVSNIKYGVSSGQGLEKEGLACQIAKGREGAYISV